MLQMNKCDFYQIFLFQVAAEFSILDSPLAVIKRLQKTDHVQVDINAEMEKV